MYGCFFIYLHWKLFTTRKHSSRMRAARLPTVRVSAAATNCGQNSWHTLLKILPSPNFVAGGNWYKYSLIFTNRMTNQKLRTRNFTTVFVYLKWKSCVRNHRNHLIWFVHLYVFLFTKDHFKACFQQSTIAADLNLYNCRVQMYCKLEYVQAPNFFFTSVH